jgi:heme-degrading monooxygenase HmoA
MVMSAPTHAFVAMSRFAVANGKTAEVKQAFRDRPRLVDGAYGFLKMDVISPEEAPEEIWLLTYWVDRESFLAWHRSPAHKQSHRFMPKGLKLDPKRTKLAFFERVSE